MSTALELVQIVEQNGGRIRIDGEDLVISPREAAMPVLDALRRHKAELLDELGRRPAMPPGVRLVRWEPKAAPVPLSQCETVLDVELFIRTSLAQLENMLAGRRWLAGNWGLAGLVERLSAVGCHVALDNPKAVLQ